MDSNETKIFTAILIAASIMGVIILFFFVTILKHHRQNLLLNKQKLLAEITTLEKERRRMAADLHDDLGPLLSAVKLQVNSVEAATREDQEIIEKSGKHLDEMIMRIREIAGDLMPQLLERKNFMAAVHAYIDRINATGALRIEYNEDFPELPPDRNRDIHLYRVTQEILNNILRHAKATQVNFTISLPSNKLIISIKDNGIGFDTNRKDFGGQGLRNMLSRVELLNGELYLDSVTGQGTNFVIEIPVAAKS
ncbi:sensor histidine kinase [Foetidibacter luteolus]|uniref:sensor histidine kinase n=1 Tax=Foetidibacter luteolus TaxID=2608880 RepID=UPI00129BDF36|nr:ATP-binding protein [Foetidibacter luteolus]